MKTLENRCVIPNTLEGTKDIVSKVLYNIYPEVLPEVMKSICDVNYDSVSHVDIRITSNERQAAEYLMEAESFAQARNVIIAYGYRSELKTFSEYPISKLKHHYFASIVPHRLSGDVRFNSSAKFVSVRFRYERDEFDSMERLTSISVNIYVPKRLQRFVETINELVS